MVNVVGQDGPESGSALPPVQASGESVVVPDVQLLLTADYSRIGDDLFLKGTDGSTLLVEGYFAADPAPALMSPSGSTLWPDQIAKLDRDLELDCSFELEGQGRFRANVFFQRGAVALVLRHAEITAVDLSLSSLAYAKRMAAHYALAGARAFVSSMSTRAPGNWQLKVQPRPGSLAILRSASWRSSTCLTIARPSPVPPSSRERLSSTR